SRPPEPSPDASGILVRPLRAATGCEFEAASETGRVMQTGSDLGYRATKGNLRCNLDPNILTRSQIQALDRTQPGLPMKKGRCGTMTHDYKRNGTTTLFAALNMLDGTVIGECMPRHRHREFFRFLKTIDQRTLPNLDLHLIVDNYATHKTPAVKRWLKRHARFHLHFTPTSGSWLNMVERFFAEITRKRIRRGVF